MSINSFFNKHSEVYLLSSETFKQEGNLSYWLCWFIKFGRSEKGTKFEKNLLLKIWCCSVASNSNWKIFSNFVPFSECPNYRLDTRPILQRNRSLTTLTKICPLLTTYPPPVDNVEGIFLKFGHSEKGTKFEKIFRLKFDDTE